MLKTQLNDAAREREALKAEKEQEREKRKNTEKELRQVMEVQSCQSSKNKNTSGCRETNCQHEQSGSS